MRSAASGLLTLRVLVLPGRGVEIIETQGSATVAQFKVLFFFSGRGLVRGAVPLSCLDPTAHLVCPAEDTVRADCVALWHRSGRYCGLLQQRGVGPREPAAGGLARVGASPAKRTGGGRKGGRGSVCALTRTDRLPSSKSVPRQWPMAAAAAAAAASTPAAAASTAAAASAAQWAPMLSARMKWGRRQKLQCTI